MTGFPVVGTNSGMVMQVDGHNTISIYSAKDDTVVVCRLVQPDRRTAILIMEKLRVMFNDNYEVGKDLGYSNGYREGYDNGFEDGNYGDT